MSRIPQLSLVSLSLLLPLGLAPTGSGAGVGEPPRRSPQETVVDVDRMGSHQKFLTPNLEDRWNLEARAGEAVSVHVSTREFDPVLRLVDPDGREVLEVDDPGSESRVLHRLDRDGTWTIVVHAFERKGGGNYQLQLDRFPSSELKVAQTLPVRLGEDGRAHFHFRPEPGRAFVLRFLGMSCSWELLDPRGVGRPAWEGVVEVEDPGLHFLRLSGRRGGRLRVELLEVESRELERDRPHQVIMPAQGAARWSFAGRAGEVVALRVQSAGPLDFRWQHAAPEGKGMMLGGRREEAMVFLPVASKEGRRRAVAVLGVDGRSTITLRSYSSSPLEYAIDRLDPVVTLDEVVEDGLEVGGARFFRFPAETGVQVHLDAHSDSFDPLLRVFDHRGRAIVSNDDGGPGLDAAVRHLFRRSGDTLVQLSSRGDGGGGSFRLQRVQPEVPLLAVGGTAEAKLGTGTQAVWAFEATAGQRVIVQVRSSTLDPAVEVLAPSGEVLGEDDDHGIGHGCLLEVEAPEAGRYVVAVRGERGDGMLRLRLIDGE